MPFPSPRPLLSGLGAAAIAVLAGVSEARMRQLPAVLDPALHPAVVMGDAASLAR
ncbi:hypothetical protein [Streptomyces sp. NBC_01477]|uniref:hypothetical protein n=1 Tax=Streptomyces sp. NBC_01477 TaxID=2976015 RepID=UPI002E37A1FC|nr:hypothetical protein [Streptomyces sp. NBC_01477]